VIRAGIAGLKHRDAFELEVIEPIRFVHEDARHLTPCLVRGRERGEVATGAVDDCIENVDALDDSAGRRKNTWKRQPGNALSAFGCSAAGVEFSGDGGGLAQLLNDQVAVSFRDDLLDVGRGRMPAEDDEACRSAAHRLVLGERERHGLRAVVREALAQELELIVAARNLFDPFVDLAEERFVTGRFPALFGFCRHAGRVPSSAAQRVR
jgi:hypothetical protein